jgi:predicted aconitase with swiveling domain
MNCLVNLKLNPIVPGCASGEIVLSRVPLSFWGGFSAQSGKVIDSRHHLVGQCLTDRILIMPQGRGSSSSSGVLLEAMRLGTAPRALICVVVEPILATASIISREMYGTWMPQFSIDETLLQQVRSSAWAEIAANESGYYLKIPQVKGDDGVL